MILFFANIFRVFRYYIRSLQGRARLVIRANELNKTSSGSWVILLSLSRNGSSAKVARLLWERGYRIHVLCPEFPMAERNFIHSWEKVKRLDDPDLIGDFQGLIARLEGKQPVAVLVEAKNLLLRAQVRISEALGLKSVGIKAVEASNSKIEMRKNLDTLATPQLPWQIYRNPEGISIDYPFVIKPARGTASKGVVMITNQQDFQYSDALASQLSKDLSVGEKRIAEAFVAGRQFDLEGVAQDGHYSFFACVEEHYGDHAPYFPPSWHYFNPPISCELRENLFARATDSLRALGVQNGAFHIEMRVDHKGNIFALDFANRMGYADLVSLSCGQNFPGAYIDVMLGKIDITKIKFTRKPVLNLFCLNKTTLAAAKKLQNEFPENIFRSSEAPFQIGHTKFSGRFIVFDKTDELLFAKLDRFGIIPKEFHQYFPKYF